MDSQFWDGVKANLTNKNKDNTFFQSFIQPIILVGTEDSTRGRRFKLGVPSQFHHDWIANHFLDRICSEIRTAYGGPFEIELIVNQTEEDIIKPSTADLKAPFGRPPMSDLGPGPTDPLSPRTEALRPDYTFESFVVGPSNEFAHACSHSVAESPGQRYNPLFIYGPSGMGKTHLLNAVGNYIKLKNPSISIRYIAAEKFLNEFTKGIRHNEMDKFRQRYREKCDVLLMDDIQVLGRGEQIQEEFFYTLNALFERGKQVVVASDRMPKDIKGLADRVRTRLEWGLVTDIQMPHEETRVAILRFKAEERGIMIPDDAVQYIARISKRSIRELEGNLNKVRMFTELQGIPISEDVARKILANHSSDNAQMTTEDIQKLVATHYGVRVPDLKAPTRTKPIVTARQMAMYLAKKVLDKSLMDIGRSFGDRDHTTVINAIRRIENQLEKDADLKKDLDELETRIHNITGV